LLRAWCVLCVWKAERALSFLLPCSFAARARTGSFANPSTNPPHLLIPSPLQLGVLRSEWWVILLCAIFQYVHGIFTQLAYRVHQPQAQPLPDLGFKILPVRESVVFFLHPVHAPSPPHPTRHSRKHNTLPQTTQIHKQELDLHWVSEAVFYTLFASVILWTFSPFVTRRPTFTTAGLFAAALPAFVLCQALRIASFMSTWLPGPAPHCRAGVPTDRLAYPAHWWGWVAVNVVRQSSMSCGDLIFSSHLIYVLGLTLVYTIWGSWKAIKAAAWAAAATISLLIIASRKHYSVDVVVAWYTVPLVFHALRGTKRWQRLAGRPDAGLPEVVVGSCGGGAAANGSGVGGGGGGDVVAVVVDDGASAAAGPATATAAKGAARSGWRAWLRRGS
jgi:sphingomyelin synthase-related protein 1